MHVHVCGTWWLGLVVGQSEATCRDSNIELGAISRSALKAALSSGETCGRLVIVGFPEIKPR